MHMILLPCSYNHTQRACSLSWQELLPAGTALASASPQTCDVQGYVGRAIAMSASDAQDAESPLHVAPHGGSALALAHTQDLLLQWNVQGYVGRAFAMTTPDAHWIVRSKPFGGRSTP